jgi:hypothetical protein
MGVIKPGDRLYKFNIKIAGYDLRRGFVGLFSEVAASRCGVGFMDPLETPAAAGVKFSVIV